MVHHVFCGGSTFQVILKVRWAIWESPNGVWVWEIWGACIAVSAFGELLQSVLILNWRCTVEGCLDRFVLTGRWHEKCSLLSLVVLQEILESSGGLGEFLGILERP